MAAYPSDQDYKEALYGVSSSYHPFVYCNYGFNGDDQGAREDLEIRSLEAQAGLGQD